MTPQSTQQLPLAQFRTALASPRAEKRVDALISHPNAQEVVQALAVPDLYYLIAEVGLGDCVELLSLCSQEQVQGCIDIEIWDRDRPSVAGLLPWLEVVRENGFEEVGRIWEGLDQELTALTLAKFCIIYDRSLEEEVPDEEERDYFDTVDTFFSIIITTDDPIQFKLVRNIIEDLYRYDMEVARHTIMSARSEPVAELEEMSYRWRSGRMADLGYTDFYESLEVFRPLDPASVRLDENTIEDWPTVQNEEFQLPALMLSPLIGRTFLAKALEGIQSPVEVEKMQVALLTLVNKVMSAGRVNPGQTEALELATLHATASIALGLEFLCDSDVSRATKALRSISLTRLHRVGYTLCLRLARFAKMIAPKAITAEQPSQLVLEAVLDLRPFFPVALEQAGSHQVRPIESLRDLAIIADHLKALALRIAIADTLGVDLDALAKHEEPRPHLDDYVRTALLRACIGGEFSATPLLDAEVVAFRDCLVATSAGRGLPDGVVPKAQQLLATLLDTSGVVEARDSLPELVASWLEQILENFSELPTSGPIESKYLGGLVIAAAMS